MKAIIIEDEYLAAQALSNLVEEIAPDMEILAVLESIDESIEWFGSHPMPDLVFMDIHLADGSSFVIFEKINITCPIIFTTAYDEYDLKAFEVNSVDYLLKPINRKELERALTKLKRLAPQMDHRNQAELLNNLMLSLQHKPVPYKSSLLISVRDKLIPLQVKEIAFIFIDAKVVKTVTFSEKNYSLDITMEEIMRQLDPQQFFRANRQYIIARSAVKDMAVWFGNKLAVSLKVTTPEKVMISRNNVREFKEWVTQ
ncbi:MAG: LytTR family DNA-binding domain-containing protein [Bacteroides sp.]|nr:LytTR family DNA-binding domain-containing protein [Bacteroides sp.]